MQNIFLEKYKDRDLKEEIFRMNQREDERFMYNVKRGKLHHLGSDTLKTLLLRTIRDKWIGLLNLMSRGDVYQLSFDEICETCKNISRGKEKVSQLASRSLSQDKLGNLFDDFKRKVISNLTNQVEMLRMQDEGKENVDIRVAESHDVNIVHHYQV